MQGGPSISEPTAVAARISRIIDDIPGTSTYKVIVIVYDARDFSGVAIKGFDSPGEALAEVLNTASAMASSLGVSMDIQDADGQSFIIKVEGQNNGGK